MSESYKNIMIGFGKGGKTLAKMMAMRGESVAIIEKSSEMYGGTCINVACIPSKSLIMSGLKHKTFEDAVAEKTALISKLRDKNYHMIADEPNAEVITGAARFLSDSEIEVTEPGRAERRTLTGERIFINTGGTPIIPDIPGIRESKNVVTSKEMMELPKLPAQLVVIGAGYIGLEFASMFHHFGSSVTVLDSKNSFLPREDDDVAARVHQDMEAMGIRFLHGVKINQIKDSGEKTEIHIHEENSESTIIADKILVAVGRKPNTEGLGLENTSIELTERGAVKTDEFLKTTVPNIWALGDVRGELQFTYISLDDSRIAASQLFGDKKRRLGDRKTVPYSVFINPTLSNVGLTEKEAKRTGREYKLFKLETAAVPKAHILNDTRGFFKVLTDPVTNVILGATIYAEESHEIINLIVLAMKEALPYTVLRDQIYTHPTMSEALNDLFK